MKGRHLEAFVDDLKAKGHALDYIQKHVISIGAMYRKGARKGWLQGGFRPFASVEPIRLPPKTLTESALLTDAEIKALLSAADADSFGQTGGHDPALPCHGSPDTRIDRRPSRRLSAGDPADRPRASQADPHTQGATPSPSLPQRNGVRDYGTTMRRALTRCLRLPRPSGGAYSNVNIAERFQTVRNRAGVRNTITIYSFRHLWISEMLMAGVVVLLVTRMAGTSVAMIERVYGHFRNQSYQEAQARLDRERATRGL